MAIQIQICKYRPVIEKYLLIGDAFFENAILEDSVAGLVVSNIIK